MMVLKKLVVIFSVLLAYGCTTTTQTTSGAEYLKRHGVESVAKSGVVLNSSDQFNEKLIDAALVEPTLEFPARIGIARINEENEISAIPIKEADAWLSLANKLGSGFGEFVPVSPLITALTNDGTQSIANNIRLAAAKQHLDAVLIYEISNRSDRKSSLLSWGALTIIGGYLIPSESLDIESQASAMLVDVVQGYPYGTANIVVESKELATLFGLRSARDQAEYKLTVLAAEKLADEVGDMVISLRTELAEKRLKIVNSQK